MEVRSRASGDEDRRDPKLLIQIPHTADKRRDRLFTVRNDALHQLIPHHKVCGGGILVDQKQACTGLNAFNDIGSLRGAAAGVCGREGSGVALSRQIMDEEGDIDIADAAGSPLSGVLRHSHQ